MRACSPFGERLAVSIWLMATTNKVTAISSLLFFIRLASQFAAQPDYHCPPFSCEKLDNIDYPLRREGDHSGRGDEKQYQITCRGNEAIMHIDSAEYCVTNMSYESGTIRLVDPMLAAGSCRLPSQSIFSAPFVWSLDWATFVNCSEAIHARLYVPVSCLSHNNNTLFVYVLVGYSQFELWMLQPSCNYLSSIPVDYASLSDAAEQDGFLSNNSRVDVFSILQKGFDILIPPNDLLSNVPNDWLPNSNVHWCLRYTRRHYRITSGVIPIFSWFSVLLKSEKRFFDCLDVSTPKRIFFYFAQSLIVFLILCRIILLPMIVYFFLAYKLWSARMIVDAVEKFLRNQKTLMPQRYAYTEIIAITRHFRDKLGQGGFGSVYRGELAGGILVAVKLLGNSGCNGDDFISEVSTIGRIHHVNVVRLVGFCSEGSRRALVYKYMPNGSLDRYIFSPNKTDRDGIVISERLVRIAIGVARGIDYLHRGCDMQILHFDIKPHNILLDYNFTPKISDFGLAKLYPKDNSLVSISAARGTIGYIAPELISRSFGVISQKSDVYSYGMLLLEMAGRRRNVNPQADNSSQVYYPSWVYDRLTQHRQEEIEVDGILEMEDLEKKLAVVGLWCIQTRPSDRPTMAKVLEMLEEGDVETLPMPPKPFLGSADPDVEKQPSLNSIATELSVVSE